MFGVAEDKSKPTAAAEDVSQQRQVTQDEYNLAKLGYKQGESGFHNASASRGHG